MIVLVVLVLVHIHPAEPRRLLCRGQRARRGRAPGTVALRQRLPARSARTRARRWAGRLVRRAAVGRLPAANSLRARSVAVVTDAGITAAAVNRLSPPLTRSRCLRSLRACGGTCHGGASCLGAVVLSGGYEPNRTPTPSHSPGGGLTT